MASSASIRTKVFISYSHKDAKYLDGLLPHLKYLEKNKLIELWADTKIRPGERWQDEITLALASTKAAILLISIDFLVSQFIVDNELPLLLVAAEAEGVEILPVILRPCTLPKSLAKFQAINSPSKPLAKMKGYEREELWVKVANAIIGGGVAQTPEISLFYTQQAHLRKEIKVTNQHEEEDPANKSYGDDFGNIRREIHSFIKKYGMSGIVMPIEEDLRKNDRGDLLSAIARHGGYVAVAERLGLQLSSVEEKSNENKKPSKEVNSKFLDELPEDLGIKAPSSYRYDSISTASSRISSPATSPQTESIQVRGRSLFDAIQVRGRSLFDAIYLSLSGIIRSRSKSFKRPNIIFVVSVSFAILLSGGVLLASAIFPVNPDPYFSGGELTFYDSMIDNSNSSFGWFETDGCRFKNGGFHVFDHGDNTLGSYATCMSSNTDLKNFAFEVQMTIISGSCGGIDFHYLSSSNYTAYFCLDGTYELNAITSTSTTSNSTGIASGSSLAILKGLNKTNVIAVVVKGNVISLYANHQKIASVIDHSSSHGSINLNATGDHDSCEVVYNNAKVWTP